MSWIDTFLSDGDPNKVMGANAADALAHTSRWRDLLVLQRRYRQSGLSIRTCATFLVLDAIRKAAYERGFRDGEDFPWPDEHP